MLGRRACATSGRGDNSRALEGRGLLGAKAWSEPSGANRRARPRSRGRPAAEEGWPVPLAPGLNVGLLVTLGIRSSESPGSFILCLTVGRLLLVPSLPTAPRGLEDARRCEGFVFD